MKLSALVAALLALSLTACGEKPVEAPVVVEAPAASAPAVVEAAPVASEVVATEAASAPAAAAPAAH